MLDKFRRCKFDLLSLRRHRHRLLNILIDKPSWVMVRKGGHLQVQNNVMQKVFARAKGVSLRAPTTNWAAPMATINFCLQNFRLRWTHASLLCHFWRPIRLFQDDGNLLPPPLSATELLNWSRYQDIALRARTVGMQRFPVSSLLSVFHHS